jgi:glycosyltransferase involved in cell wall biosynthesis
MRIGVIESAPRGGLLHYAAQLSEALARRGNDVVLVTARGSEMSGRLDGAVLRAVLPAASGYMSEPPVGWRYLVRRAGVAFRLIAAGVRTVWEVRRGRFDTALLVDDLNVSLAAAAPLVLSFLPGGPVLATVCHEPRPRNRWSAGAIYARSRALRMLLLTLYRRVDLVLVHGDRSRDEFEATWRRGRAAVIPHGHAGSLAPRELPPAAEARILFFGDWRRSKGMPELMQAFDTVRRRRPEVTLTIAGTPYPDAEPERVRAWAARHGDAVSLIDRYVPLEQVPDLFMEARVVVTPYVAGSQSGVVHLAMSFGRAVVSSDVGELGRTVVHAETGYVVPAGDVDALAEALERLVSDPAAAERFGRAARTRMLSEASWDDVAARLESHLVSVVESRNSGR